MDAEWVEPDPPSELVELRRERDRLKKQYRDAAYLRLSRMAERPLRAVSRRAEMRVVATEDEIESSGVEPIDETMECTPEHLTESAG